MQKERPPWFATSAVDVGAGCIASAAVSPFILVIDQAIIEAAAKKTTLFRGIGNGILNILRQPRVALMTNPAYWMMAGVYGVTYAAANTIDSVCERAGVGDAVHGTTKLLGTTAVNTSACIAKDVAFARMFGVASTRPMPKVTIGLFAVRDLLCVGSAFTVPPLLASGLSSSGSMDKRQAEDAAQLISPVGMQLLCAPLHLLGLNFYNMPTATARERAAAVARTAPQTIVAFSVRMAPAFGVGTLLNTSLTSAGREAVSRHYAGLGAATSESALRPLPSRDRAAAS